MKKPLLLLTLLFVVNLCIMWPGVMSADGMEQYAIALSGVYRDHHPPMMSLVWRYLNYIYTGPGMMLLFHFLMLYAAAAIFIYCFRDSKFKWWFAVFPFIPGVFAYMPLIVKDVGLACSYLLAGAILAYLMLGRITRHKWPLLGLVLLLLFYGTAVKYQARFLLVFFTIGVGYCIFNYKHGWKSLLSGVALYLLLLQAMFSFNAYLVPVVQKSHSWQYVKLYDLAAMSLAQNQALFPPFVIQNPNFSMQRLKSTFVPYEVDSLAFTHDAVLIIGRNDTERELLLEYWQNTVRQHPWLYLKVRFRLWTYTLTGTPSDKTNPAHFLSGIPAFKPIVTQPLIYDAIGSMYQIVKVSLQFTWLLPLLLIYTVLSMAKLNTCRAATPLLIFSLTSLSLLGILFFMSMYGTARYVFICVCLVHASHGFAYRCLTGR